MARAKGESKPSTRATKMPRRWRSDIRRRTGDLDAAGRLRRLRVELATKRLAAELAHYLPRHSAFGFDPRYSVAYPKPVFENPCVCI